MTHPDKKNQRLYFFDNLRAGIILLMVIFHIAMGFTTWDLKWWYINDMQKNFFFDLFVLETDVYIMPIMFLIAGYFAPMILLQKGAIKFWKNKLVRIVLPWGIGVVFFAPLLSYSPLVTHIGPRHHLITLTSGSTASGDPFSSTAITGFSASSPCFSSCSPSYT